MVSHGATHDRSRILDGCLVLLFLLLTAKMRCGGARTNVQSLDDLARAYCRIALALGERDPDALDFYAGPKGVAEAVHKSYPTLEQTCRDADSLNKQLQHFPAQTGDEVLRVQFMQAQLVAVRTRIEMLRGTRFDFDTEARLLFGVQRLADEGAATRRATLSRIDRLLPGRRGHDLAERHAVFGARFIVPRDKLPAVMQVALDLCRQRTLERLALPAGESVNVVYVRNKPWNAFSHYRGHAESTIEINTDSPLTIDRALELACHEGYPGHHVFNTIRDAALAQRNGWPEAQVQLTFSPQSFLSEAAAAYAPNIALSLPERIAIERDILFPLAGISREQAAQYVTVTEEVGRLDAALPAIAREYLEGRLEFVRAQQRLEAEALMAHSEATLLYLNEYRTYMLAYTDGRRQIAASVDAAPSESARWLKYRSLMEQLISPQIVFSSGK